MHSRNNCIYLRDASYYVVNTIEKHRRKNAKGHVIVFYRISLRHFFSLFPPCPHVSDVVKGDSRGNFIVHYLARWSHFIWKCDMMFFRFEFLLKSYFFHSFEDHSRFLYKMDIHIFMVTMYEQITTREIFAPYIYRFEIVMCLRFVHSVVHSYLLELINFFEFIVYHRIIQNKHTSTWHLTVRACDYRLRISTFP